MFQNLEIVILIVIGVGVGIFVRWLIGRNK